MGEEVAAAAESALGAKVKAQTSWLGLDVRATGLWAGCVCIFASLAVEVTMLDHKNPQHFLLMAFTCAMAGGLLVTAVMNGRVRDALADKEYYRNETNRIAGQKAKLEKLLMKKRESSVPPKQS